MYHACIMLIIYVAHLDSQSLEEKKQRLLALAKRKREEVAATAKSRLDISGTPKKTQRWLFDVLWNFSGVSEVAQFILR